MDNNPKERLGYLDTLRGLAALWIAIHHMTYQSFSSTPTYEPPPWLTDYVNDGGQAGVSLFLIMSAFSLCHTMAGHQQESRPLLKFYLRRFFRIAPVFYMVLLLKICEDKIIYGADHTVSEIAANVLFIFGLFPEMFRGIAAMGWTIGVLSLFYLFFPLFFRLFNSIMKTAAFVVVSILLANIFSFVLTFFPSMQKAFFPWGWTFPLNLPIFATGMFIFYLLRTPLLRNKTNKIIWIILIVIGVFIYIEFINARLAESYYGYVNYLRVVILSVIFIGFAKIRLKIVTNRVTTFLGKISYSLWLCHPHVVWLLGPFYTYVYLQPIGMSLKFLTISCVTIIAAVMVSFIVYQLIEKPGITLGKRLMSSIDSYQRARIKA